MHTELFAQNSAQDEYKRLIDLELCKNHKSIIPNEIRSALTTLKYNFTDQY